MNLVIPNDVEARIHDYVMSVDSEIAGLGKVRVEGEDIVVEEVMICEQTVTSVTADLSPQAMAKFQTELVRAGGSPKDWRLWFHSHDTMAAFFSKRDTDTMDEQTESDWIVSLVVNKKRERKARLDTYRPFRMFMDDIDIQIGEGGEYTVPQDIQDEVALKVKQSVPTYKGKVYAKPIGYGNEYNRTRLISLTKTLESQLADFESRGLGESNEYMEAAGDLVEHYYSLAMVEPSSIIADSINRKAEALEAHVYCLESVV